MDVRVLATSDATISALETLLSGSESVAIASAFVRYSGVEELQLLQRPLEKLRDA